MLKKLLLSAFVLTLAMAAHIYARSVGDKGKREREKLPRLETTVRELPDSVFNPVEMEDLLNDEVYLKLAHEGWSPEEIVRMKGRGVFTPNFEGEVGAVLHLPRRECCGTE